MLSFRCVCVCLILFRLSLPIYVLRTMRTPRIGYPIELREEEYVHVKERRKTARANFSSDGVG